ncbi:MAG TPA: DNA methyltransferase, partial [Ktedonobacterales bacterium]
WKTTPEGLNRLERANRIAHTGRSLSYVRFLDDFAAYALTNVWTDIGGIQSRSDPIIYVVQTSTSVIERCMLMATDPGDLVIDPTCGSGTTAYVAEQWGRRWITADTSRVALALARTRLMAARFPYYLLADSEEGAKKESEITGQFAPGYKYADDLRKGFVYKRIPHVKITAIAENAQIDTIYAKWQSQLEPVRARLNAALEQTWEEWQIPREAAAGWSEAARQAHVEWWRMRRERQQEIDASIARNAETELLYDQPYEDPRRVRVTGPFTVESLSPHRVLSPEEERPASEAEAQRDDTANQFVLMILDNLKKAGVQNTVASERLTFDRLEPVTGQWIQARGEYKDAAGSVRRVAVSVGPQYGTVGAEQVQEAAIEATRGMGCDAVILCGFAFDAMAGEKSKELSPEAQAREGFVAEQRMKYGKVQVLLAKMNPDLSMGDALLKKTGAGNLFMVFGEPDIHIGKQSDGRIVAHIRGLDIYDPTTGEIRSSSTQEIACWFIDTNYDGRSFFVRHAYFTGGDEPYEKLKRTLRAEIDEAAWSALYAAESLPFDAPTTGKIAVKVINHYGDEVLKVYSV